MSEINRKLATVERIVSLEKHPNADTLDLIGVRGWTVISKSGQHKINDLVVYFEIDSFLPVDDRYEFLRKGGFKSTKNLGDGFRLRTMKLRGEISQGLILPLSEFVNDLDLVKNEDGQSLLDFIHEGFDLTEILGVQKYEKPIPSNLAGVARGNFPPFIPKTDQERWQNLTYREKTEHINDEFEMTLKMDGSSMTVYYNEGVFGVCSRNLDLLETEDNIFWKVANKLCLRKLFENIKINFAIQGECVGPGIQNNPHKLKEHDLYVFDVYIIDKKEYVSSKDRKILIKEFENRGFFINHVKFLGNFNGIPTKEDNEVLCKEKLSNEEGIVFKSINDPSFSFKFIDPAYLLKEKD